MPTSHRLSFSTCLSHPRSIHLLCHLDSPSAANLPCLGLQQQIGPEISELCGSYRVPSRSSLLLLTLSHLERVTHRLGKTCLFNNNHLPHNNNRPHLAKNCVVATVNWDSKRGFPKQMTDRRFSPTRHQQLRDIRFSQPAVLNKLTVLGFGDA
jgi:hypothetical protein